MAKLSFHEAYKEAVAHHRQIIQDDLKFAGQRYSEETATAIQKYYVKIVKGGRRLRFLEHNYAMRIAPILCQLDLLSQRRSVRILDAGCGLGSELLLFARRGCQCVGVDLHKNRFPAAKERVAFWKLEDSVEFVAGDVCSLELGMFDAIFSMEALTHISPINSFLQRSAQNLNGGGLILLTDPNPLNLYWQIYVLKVRGLRKHYYITDSLAGGKLRYANERLISPNFLKRTLRKYSVHTCENHFSIFAPPFLYTWFPSIEKIDFFLRRIPVLRNLGAIYTVIAKKDQIQ